MRIIPYELYKYAPDQSLTALRKEFGMHDYCLNNNKKNIAMQPFLDLGKNYFDLSFYHWALEMKTRNHYLSSFHEVYFQNSDFQEIETNIFLILECCVQWDLKGFEPYKTNLSWFQIAQDFIQERHQEELTPNIYQEYYNWYQLQFMRENKTGKLKPQKLNMDLALTKIKELLIKNSSNK